MEKTIVTEHQFRDKLQYAIRTRFDRALAVFKDYGPVFSRDVTNILVAAHNKGLVDEVLEMLEEYFFSYLMFHLDNTPVVEGQDPTHDLFIRIYMDVLRIRIMDPVP